MAWYIWVALILSAVFVYVIIAAVAKANEPFRYLDDQEQIKYLANLKKKE